MSEKRSRIKKYAELRDELTKLQTDKIETKELSSFANKLHEIDDQHFENMNIENFPNEHEPLHKKELIYDEAINKQESQLGELFETASHAIIEDTDSFKSDYLSDFISEAKQYNVDKGFRVDYDTKSNLLKELKAQRMVEKGDSVSDVTFEDVSLEEESTELDSLVQEDDEILETEDYSNEEPSQDMVDTELENHPINQEHQQNTIMMQVEKLANQEITEADLVEFNEQDLIEATTQLKLELDKQSEVVKNMENQIDKTSRSMNILLWLLIICLFVLIAVFGYILLKMNGFI